MTLEELIDINNRLEKLEKKQKIQIFINNTLSMAIIFLELSIIFK